MLIGASGICSSGCTYDGGATVNIINADEVDRLGRELRYSLVKDLTAAGDLISPRWVTAFMAVPRHAFVPKFFVDRDNTGTYEMLDSADAVYRKEWLERVYSNEPLPIHIENTKWVSSSSQPSLMAMMLEALDIAGDERILEIGTGTGYNAALLCEMLGDEQVASVDVDAQLVNEARERLASVSYYPTLAAVDGVGGYPGCSPYDRIIATCSVDRIPLQWIAQTRKDGLILANLNRPLGGGAIALLSVSKEGASGHFAPFSGGFMPTRGHSAVSALDLLAAHRDDNSTKRPTRIDADILDDDAFSMFAALRLSAQRIGLVPEDGPEQLWLLGHDGSWACQTRQDATSSVSQGGPAKLWDALENAYDEWVHLGRPPREAFGLTVTPTGGHVVWHDSPEGQTWTL